jgi:Tfp pilus assembly protein PilX
MRARSGKRRGGFILPTTLLVMTVLTVMLAAAFVLVSAEYRVTDNSFASSRALAIAQAGLQNYFSVGHNLSGTSDSADYTFPGGYARVLAVRVRDSVTVAPRSPPLWIVRSIGYDTVRAPSGQPNGLRAVAQFAQALSANLPIRGAVVAANGVQVSAGGTNPISNVDAANNLPGCARPVPANVDVGLMVPTGGYTTSKGADPTGGIFYLPSAANVNDSTHIDWRLLLAGQFTPDYVNQFPPANNSTYQIHYFTGNATVPTGIRSGTLVARGNVLFSEGTRWNGVIIAGGAVDGGPPNVNTNYQVYGAVMSGLNLMVGLPVPTNQVRRGGTRFIQWDWCYAHASFSSLAYLGPIKNAWVDTWSTY